MLRMISKSLEPVSRRLRLMIGRAMINLVNDAAKEQLIQVSLLSGETRQVERYQHYGFTSVPLSGAEAILAAVGGSRDHLVSLADGDRRYRPRGLEPGEVAIYDHNGLMILLKTNGDIEVTNCGTFSSDGHVADSVSTMQAMRDIFNSHTHNSGPAPDQEMD